MLPTALRSSRVGSILARSELFASAAPAIELLCDPLQRVLNPGSLQYCAQTTLIHYACQSPFLARSPIHQDINRVTNGKLSVAEQSQRLQVPLLRHYEDQPVVRSDNIVVYEGPLKKAVHSLKRLSLFSCAATFAMSPIMLIFDTSATSLGAKASIAITLCSFGIFTTGLLHWFTSPYVRQLVYDRKSNTMDIETLSVFARPQITRAHLSEIAYPDTIRPQVTFAVNGKFFYLDENTFPDKALLAALTPPEPSAAGTISK